MREIAQKILSFGEKLADAIEVFCISGKKLVIEIKRNEIELATQNFFQGIGIRVLIDGRMGISSTNDPKKTEDAVLEAVKLARVSDRDDAWKFPVSAEYQPVQGIYDERIDKISPEEGMHLAAEMIGETEGENVKLTSGSLSFLSCYQLIMNSNGIEIDERETVAEGFATCIAKDGGEVSTANEFGISRNLDIDFFEIGRSASDLARRSLHGVKIFPSKKTVLLAPLAFAEIIEETFSPSISADNVQKDRSFLKGKIGEVVADEGVSIIDDGTMHGGIGSSKSDDEGVPSTRNVVIERGVLKSFLHNVYTASKEGVSSTGNGVRSSYSSLPRVDIRNLIFDYPPSEVISETKEGVLVTSVIGAHTANEVSGDFSLEARNAFLIKDGSIEKPIKSLMISGNVFDLLKQIDGADFKKRMIGSIVVPMVRVREMYVV
ncbi:MAG: TldD/PmbA family protein [Candidatus Syntropharchaeia archaeon]